MKALRLRLWVTVKEQGFGPIMAQADPSSQNLQLRQALAMVLQAHSRVCPMLLPDGASLWPQCRIFNA